MLSLCLTFSNQHHEAALLPPPVPAGDPHHIFPPTPVQNDLKHTRKYYKDIYIYKYRAPTLMLVFIVMMGQGFAT